MQSSDIRKAYEANPSLETAAAYIEDLKSRIERLKVIRTNEHMRDSNILRLANLGMSAEIGGHEFARILAEFRGAQENLPPQIGTMNQILAMADCFQQLSHGLRHLREASVSRSDRRITGADIEDHLRRTFSRLRHMLIIDREVSRVTLFARPSLVYPVFVNLVGNGLIWAKKGKEDGTPPMARVSFRNGWFIVSDTGPGVSEEDAPYIFDPLFTKGDHHGTGVGLYLVADCLKAAYGKIELVSDPAMRIERGANFRFKYPACDISN